VVGMKYENKERRIVLTLSMSGIIGSGGLKPLSNSLSGFPTQLLFLAENIGLEVICMVYNQVRSHIWRITAVCWNSMYSRTFRTFICSLCNCYSLHCRLEWFHLCDKRKRRIW